MPKYFEIDNELILTVSRRYKIAICIYKSRFKGLEVIFLEAQRT